MCDVYENTDVLNGVPYRICVSWDVARTGDAVLQRGADINEKIKMLVCGEKYRRVWQKDSTVTSIIFRTSCNRHRDGVRLDHESSEEPVYATYDGNGTVIISTPAAGFQTCGAIGNMFENLEALKRVEGFDLINKEDAIDASVAAYVLP